MFLFLGHYFYILSLFVCSFVVNIQIDEAIKSLALALGSPYGLYRYKKDCLFIAIHVE